MKQLIALIALAPLLCSSADTWTELFNGENLDGWVQRGGTATYQVENGVIVGTSVAKTKNSFLCTEKDYGDFILEFEFMVDPMLNSGVQIRSESKPDYRKGVVHGYQCEIDPSDRGWTTGIYDESRRGWLNTLEDNDAARFAFKQGDWNLVRIEAIGPRIRTFLNGVPAADLKDGETLKGFIALQVHGVPDEWVGREVRWRNLRIMENPKAGSPEPGDSQPPASPIPDDVEVRHVASGFKFTEGPALGPDGRIYFSDIPNERIHIYDPASGETSLHRENTGRANGLMFLPSGALIACEGGNSRMTRQLGDEVVPFATEFEGQPFNSPNDVDLDGKGGLYFTDPAYGKKPEEIRVGGEHVYHATANRKYFNTPAKVTRVVDSLVRPNGVLVSNDHRTLYVVDNGSNSLWAFDIEPKAGVTNGRKLCEFKEGEAKGGDGLTSDEFGNLYVAAQGIYVISPEGKQLGVIEVPERPANCVFGAKGSRTLYITARTGLYAVELNVDGRR
jgi:sugar lactone lactonase YvrE